jgi:hypothetical protein
MKTCIKCNESKEFHLFPKKKGYKDGHYPYCISCKSLCDKESYLKHKEKRLLKNKQYYLNNKEKITKINKDWVQNNQDKVKSFKRKYYQKNIQSLTQKRNQWKKDNPDKVLASKAKRRAIESLAYPSWLSPEHIKEIQYMYKEARRLTKETKIPHHVDHIIPLRNPNVCGLHVPWNLQILTDSDNYKKNNSFDGTYENQSWVVC